MFVAMGLSAVFPIFHGVEIYGIANMRERIGLSWMVLQGFFYVLGAGLYAVSVHILFSILLVTDNYRLDFRNELGLENLIFGEVHIRYSMFWSSWLELRICMGCLLRLIIITMS